MDDIRILKQKKLHKYIKDSLISSTTIEHFSNGDIWVFSDEVFAFTHNRNRKMIWVERNTMVMDYIKGVYGITDEEVEKISRLYMNYIDREVKKLHNIEEISMDYTQPY